MPIVDKDALDHAWDWFEYHANQRMTMIRFYLVVAGAIGTGAGYLFIQREYWLSILLSLYGAIVSYCFLRLDNRVSGLVKLGEDALKKKQGSFAVALGDEFKICENADNLRDANNKRRFAYPYTYGENFRLMLGLSSGLFFILALYNLHVLKIF